MAEGHAPIPGWYADPLDAGRIRWWDGAAWTQHTKPHPTQGPPVVAEPAPPMAYPEPAPPMAYPEPPVPTPAYAEPPAPPVGPVPAFEPMSEPAVPPLVPPVVVPPAPGIPLGPADSAAAGESILPGGPRLDAVPASPFAQGDYRPTYGGTDTGFPASPSGAGPGIGLPSPEVFASAGPTEPSEPPRKKSRKTLLILLIILGVLIVAAAVVWYLMFRPAASKADVERDAAPPVASTSAASPNPFPQAGDGQAVPAACTSAVDALTGGGSTSAVVAKLQAASGNQNLADAAGFFADVNQQAASVMASAGAPCVDAVKAGQAPATYATFIEQFGKSTRDGAALAGQGATSKTGLTPDQVAVLQADASALAAAQSAVAPNAQPAAPPPVG